MTDTVLLEWFSSYAYEPLIVYTAIITLMFASSFGLPIPEEVTLISAGLLAYVAVHTDQFPPPEPGATSVSVAGLAIVCFFAVFLSDLVIYSIGRIGGSRLRRHPRFARLIPPAAMSKAERWTEKYGAWMSGVFRFTPGLRFPGHMACGMMGVPLWKFCAVDGTAALLTVPTQIYLVATYGDTILEHIKQFKVALFASLIAIVLVYVLTRLPAVRRLLGLGTPAL